MSGAKKSFVLYVIIAVLVMALAASIGYNIGNANTAAASNRSTASVNAINSKVLKEIEDLKSIYDSKIAEKKATYKDLETEKQKVQSLMAALEKSKGDANALLKYKEEYQHLEAKMRLLVDEIVVLKSNKSRAVTTRAKAVKPVLTEARKPKMNPGTFGIRTPNTAAAPAATAVPEVKNEVVESVPKAGLPEKKAEKAYASLDVSQLRAGGFISKSAYVKEETTSAAKTDLIRITFLLEANEDAKAEEKKYFIQVVDGNNKVLGRRITEFFDDKSITYSMSRSVHYDNAAVPVSQELVADEFGKGTYTVNVYERSRLVGKTTFTLR